jgi:beta-glucanase (GH16 family)
MNQTCHVNVNGKAYKFKYYLNGQLSTQSARRPFAQTYGMFAARMKFPEKRGKHGSFWMQPMKRQYLEGNPKDSGAEIDIVEFFGRGYADGGLASFLYNYGVLGRDGKPKKIGGMAPSATRSLPSNDAWWKNYHVFSLEWNRKRYIFRVDGREHFRTSAGVSGVDEYLILSILSSDWELRDAQKLGVRPLGTMKVDWVRGWTR